MARSDLVINLGVAGNTTNARIAAGAIAAAGRAKRYGGVTDRISRALLDAPRSANGGNRSRPGLRVQDGSGGILRRETRRPLRSRYLDPAIRAACDKNHRGATLCGYLTY